MDVETIKALFKKHEKEHGKFERVQNKRSDKADLHAFLLLDSICPDRPSIIDGAEHEGITLNVFWNISEKDITEEQIIELIRCGVLIGDSDNLFMFV